MNAKEKFGRDYATDFDIDDPGFAEHWEDVVEDLHERCPVARSEVGEGYWVLNKYRDITECAREWETFSSADGFMPNRADGIPFMYPTECDPPFHDQLRKRIDRFFGPTVVTEYVPGIERVANELIDRFVEAGSADAVADYSALLPGTVFCNLVAGMPAEDMPALGVTLNEILYATPERRGAAMGEGQEYIEGFLKRRSEEERRDDVTEAILSAEIDGFDWPDKVNMLTLLTLGGVGTTGNVIACGLHYFALNRDLRERFLADPDLRPRAVEEFLRIYAPAIFDGRRLRKDIVVSGTEMRAGDYVVFGYGPASQDPEVSPDPRAVDFERRPNRHLAFGAGPHRCAGSHLARAQLRVAFEVFLERLGDYRVPEDFDPLFEQGITRSMRSLPIRFEAGQRVGG